MVKTLHLLNTAPDDLVASLIASLADNTAATVICLYPDEVSATAVNWDRVIDDIFSHDTVICWG